MQAGTLNEIITVEKQTYISTGYGSQKTIDWEPKIRTRANVTYVSGGRVNENNELFFGCNVVFSVRIYHDIRNLDRIVWRNDKYRILNIERDKKVQRLLITTELINE